MIDCVFWDSDNTLVETAGHHWCKHFEILKSYGITLGDEYREKIYTNNGAQNWEWLTAELGLHADRETYLAQIDTWYFDHIAEIAVRPGVLEALGIFSAAGIPQAVVSNGRRNSVMAALNASDIASSMEFILCKEDYEGRKPGPEPYLAALRRMEKIKGKSIKPSSCLVIEDDPKGVESGHNAGMIVFHRKMEADQEKTPYAKSTFFSADELLSACRDILKS